MTESLAPEEAAARSAFSLVLIALMKGVLQAEDAPATWQALLELQARVRDYVAQLGLELILDEVERHAYLRQRPAREGEVELPRLVPRRPLGFQVSLLLVLLRKKLAEADAQGDSTRVILTQEQIADLVRVFLPDRGNEARLLDRLETNINKIVELGFLRRLRGKQGELEIQRILKAFVDAQWLSELDGLLASYAAQLEQGAVGGKDDGP